MNFHFIYFLRNTDQRLCKQCARNGHANRSRIQKQYAANEIERLVEIEINHSRLFECQIRWRNVCAHYSWLLLFMAKSEMKNIEYDVIRLRFDFMIGWMWKSGNHFKQPSSQMVLRIKSKTILTDRRDRIETCNKKKPLRIRLWDARRFCRKILIRNWSQRNDAFAATTSKGLNTILCFRRKSIVCDL